MATAMSSRINPRLIDADVHLGNTSLLKPIEGYEKEELLPLELACRPLEGILDALGLRQHVALAKSKSQNPANNLSPDESASIRLYTMEWQLYRILNNTFRQADRSKLRPWFPYLKLLLTALFKLPWIRRQVVWRGVACDLTGTLQKSKKEVWWSITSCSIDLTVVNYFLETQGGPRTLLAIDTGMGKDISRHSNIPSEQEIILVPGTHLEVQTATLESNGLYIVHLKDRRPPEQLLASPFPGARSRAAHATVSSASSTDVISSSYHNTTLEQKIDQQRHLVDVDFKELGLKAADLNRLADEVQRNHLKWRRLNLWNNGFGPTGATHLRRILEVLPLDYLHLGLNHLGPEGVEHLQVLRGHRTLTELDLWDNSIGDDGVRTLARFLQDTVLQKLNLGVNLIGDQGCQSLFLALPRTLTHLNLYSNRLSTRSLQTILNTLNSSQTRLIELNLEANTIASDPQSKDTIRNAAGMIQCTVLI